MISPDPGLLSRFHRVLAEELRRQRGGDVLSPFTVAEIYQSLVPYRTHRDVLELEMNGDYEDALLRLLAGEGGYLQISSEPARAEFRDELKQQQPNTGLFREFAAIEVRLDPARLDRNGSGPGRVDEAGPTGGPGAEPVSSPTPTPSRPSSAPRPSPPPERPPVPSSDRQGRNDLQLGLSSKHPDEPSRSPGEIMVEPSEAEADPFVPSGLPETASGAAVEPVGSAPSGATPSSGPAPEDCPDCARPLPARSNVHFCPFCGVNVRLVPCGECGEEMERSWRFCVVCGSNAP